MFSMISKRYDELINNLNNITLKTAIEVFRKISADRQLLFENLSKNIKNETELHAIKLVSDFLLTDDKTNFFDRIDSIRSQTQNDCDERINSVCSQWNEILDSKEELFKLLFKDRISTSAILFGTINNKKLEWVAIRVEPLDNYIQLVTIDSVDSFVYKENGYTDIENEDEFGCAELACSWAASDIRKYLNSSFYNDAFAASEKAYIVKTYRHINKGDFLIQNDCSQDYIYLLTSEELLNMDSKIRVCSSNENYDTWWLCDQKKRGWADTEELPEIYSVKCKTGELISQPATQKALLRVGITVDLDLFINNIVEKM